jgi:predicted Zn-dependent peptidase
MKYTHQKLSNGISLHMLPMDNYKTTFVGVFFYWPLGNDVAETALIPHVLQRGTASFPTARELRSHLANLYGSQFGIGVLKRAENLLVQLKIQLVDDHYIPGNNSLLESVLDILREVVLHPYTEHGDFTQRYVTGEKRNIQARIRSLLNDKSRFAFHRCLQHLCPESGYSKNKYGTLEQVEAITPEGLWQQYQRLLREAAVDIYVCGRYDHNRVVDAITRRFNWDRGTKVDPREIRTFPPRDPQIIKERMDISQGKLVMALTTDITQKSDLYPALILYNGILGGFPHSKLFQQVREEKGLAYYIGSSLDSIMGLQFISAGIDAKTFGETDEVILQQLEEMRRGHFNHQELEWTRAGIRTGLLQMFDDLGEQVALAVDGRISGRRWTLESLLSAIDQVDSRQIVEVAEQMHLQTSYFLSNGGEASASHLQ